MQQPRRRRRRAPCKARSTPMSASLAPAIPASRPHFTSPNKASERSSSRPSRSASAAPAATPATAPRPSISMTSPKCGACWASPMPSASSAARPMPRTSSLISFAATRSIAMGCRTAMSSRGTGAYPPIFGAGLWRSFTILSVAVLATQPLSSNLRKVIAPENNTVVETRGDPMIFKYNKEGRLVTSVFVEGRRGSDLAYTKELTATKLKWILPQLGEIDWQYYWFGDVDMQPRTIPRLFELAPGIVASLGYSGRGVPTGTVMGTVLAEWAMGKPVSELALKPEPFAPAPLYMKIAPRAFLAYSRWRDQRMGKISLARGSGTVSTLLLVVANPGIRPSVIAHFILKDRSAMARLLDQLKRKGLMIEKVNAAERRAHELYLTPKGYALSDRVRAFALKQSEDFFSVLSEAERQQLRPILKKLYETHIAEIPKRG